MTDKQPQQAVLSQNLTDRITAILRDDVISGKYPPGQQLPSGKELSQLFGVSITVIREALSRLKSDGLIASHQGKGVFVENDAKARPFRLISSAGEQNSILQIFELRQGVEVQAAILAAERRKPRDLVVMEKCLQRMKPSPGQKKQARASFDKALSSDLEFHRAIAKATQNPLIVSFTEFLQPHLQEAIAIARANSAIKQTTEAAAYEEHHELYEAIAASDSTRARVAARRILEGSLRRLKDSGQIKRK